MSDAEDTVQLLRVARRVIEPEGAWCQGAYFKSGTRCAVGALVSVVENTGGRQLGGVYDRARTLLRRASARRLGQEDTAWPGSGPILDYNDAETTTQADVLSLYDEAIEAAKKEVTS